MALTHIKMPCGLESDIALFRIHKATGVSVNETIGALYRLWQWADRHTYDGSTILDLRSLTTIVRDTDLKFWLEVKKAGYIQTTPTGFLVVGRGQRRREVGPANARGFVYFVLSPATGLVKIGFTSISPSVRIAELQTATADSLQLIASIPGRMALERQLHKQFITYRRAREWFEYTGDLQSYVESLIAQQEYAAS